MLPLSEWAGIIGASASGARAQLGVSAPPSWVTSPPWWLTAAVALFSALFGFGARWVIEEWRDFRGAQRVVVSELHHNHEVLKSVSKGIAGSSDVLSDSAYRNVQLVLARNLDDPLWRKLEKLYNGLTPEVKAHPDQIGRDIAKGLTREFEKARDQLRRFNYWAALMRLRNWRQSFQRAYKELFG